MIAYNVSYTYIPSQNTVFSRYIMLLAIVLPGAPIAP